MKLAFRNASAALSRRSVLSPNAIPTPILPHLCKTLPLPVSLPAFRLFASSSPPPMAAVDSAVELQFEKFRDQLQESGNLRERIRDVATEIESVTRLVHASLLLVHQSRPVHEVLEKARGQIGKLKELFSQLAEIISGCPEQYYRYHNDWRSETQSVVSLLAFMHWLETGSLLMHCEAEEKIGLNNRQDFTLDIEDYLVIVTSFGEISESEFLDPRTAQVAVIDHVKQVCTDVRPATDEELPSLYIEGFRCVLDEELMKYVMEAYPKGISSVYCVKGKDVEGPGSDFEFVLAISAARHSPQNFCNGSWRSIWNIGFKDEEQTVELKGKIQVVAHYFEEGNVQLDSDHECQDSIAFQSPEDLAVTITHIIRHHETEYLTSLEASYVNLPDTTFKDLRRKLPVTRTLFPWHNTLQISLTRDISKELGVGN